MASFSPIDIIIILVFFSIVLLIGFIPKKEKKGDTSEYLLSGRRVGLFLFIMTNVSSWYGGILGVGEFTYKYGLLSWFTQGLPYYLFAILFAFLFAKKIRNATLYTIPDKLEKTFGKKVGFLSSILVFILVSPAPYILMVANLFMMIFGLKLLPSLILSVLLSSIYLLRGGYKTDLYTDVFQFFIMFGGFIMIVFISIKTFGGMGFLIENLPSDHLKFTSNVSPVYVLVWFLIAMWTFADPGFHQRCYAARDGKTAFYGILISVFFWMVFDFCTTTTGLFARAALPGLANPVQAFPMYAEKLLGSGTKGIFYAAMFATIMSTMNSFIFLSGTTLGRDIIFKLRKDTTEKNIPFYTRIGLVISAAGAITFAYFVPSVISLWYIIGSICIPGIVLLVIGAYYEKWKVPYRIALIELTGSVTAAVLWFFFKNNFTGTLLGEIEPMIAGLLFALCVHLYGVFTLKLASS